MMGRLRPTLAVALLGLAGPLTAATVTLINGDVLRGSVTVQGPDSVTLEHPALGTLVIERGKIEQLELMDGEPKAQAVAAVPEPVPPSVKTGLFGTDILAGWKHKLEAGVTGAQGKSENLNMRAGFSSAYEDATDRWQYEMVYGRTESEGELSENDFFAELTKDWLRPGSRWFSFAEGRYDWDEFKDWDHRLHGSGGVGYQFLDTNIWQLAGRAGLGASQTIGGDREELVPEGLLGLQGRWQLNGQQSLKFRTTFFPRLDELGEFRNISSLDWLLDLNEARSFALKLGIANEYDSQTSSTTDNNDFRYYGALVWGL